MYAIEIITLKFRRSRKIIDRTTIIIRKGKIDYNVLKKKIDLNELCETLRQKMFSYEKLNMEF